MTEEEARDALEDLHDAARRLGMEKVGVYVPDDKPNVVRAIFLAPNKDAMDEAVRDYVKHALDLDEEAASALEG